MLTLLSFVDSFKYYNCNYLGVNNMRNIQLTTCGVRGSKPAAEPSFMLYGGNTTCYVVRTPSNSLIYLDAGTGVIKGLRQLEDHADNVVLAFSHTHADHLEGLAMPNALGLPPLASLQNHPGYNDQKVHLFGPHGFIEGLEQYHSPRGLWPVSIRNYPSLDFDNATHVKDNGTYQIDDTTKITTIFGNHPCLTELVMYRIDMEAGGQTKTIVFATDNEFDYLARDFGVDEVNPNAGLLKDKYIKLINGADILIAEAQYATTNYMFGQGSNNVRGFGHSHPIQILNLAKDDVGEVLITHHDRLFDSDLEIREQEVKRYGESLSLKTNFARENSPPIIL
jgi:ribonuclease BN (tRNA processing enzyme)